MNIAVRSRTYSRHAIRDAADAAAAELLCCELLYSLDTVVAFVKIP